MADPDETFLRVIEAAQRSYAASERLWRDVLGEARRRLAADPLFAAQVAGAVGVLEAEARRHSDPEMDAFRHGGRLGAALALVIAERPELITGESPTGAPPVEVIAARLGPLLGPDYSHSISLIRQAAGSVLTALALQGYEVTRRADRFATLERDDGRRLRLPLRGTCGICRGPVTRQVIGGQDVGEVLIGAWGHAAGDPDGGGHRPGLVDAP